MATGNTIAGIVELLIVLKIGTILRAFRSSANYVRKVETEDAQHYFLSSNFLMPYPRIQDDLNAKHSHCRLSSLFLDASSLSVATNS